MATTVTRFRAGTAGLTDSSTYSVPAANTAIVTSITASNKTSNTRTFTVLMAGYSFCTALQIPANGTVNFDTRQVLLATETISVTADAASSVDFLISGVLVN